LAAIINEVWTFEKVALVRTRVIRLQLQKSYRKKLGVVVRGLGCLRGAIRAALNFFAPLFSFKRKKGKTNNRKRIAIGKKLKADAGASPA
jgi:hypothetical protein